MASDADFPRQSTSLTNKAAVARAYGNLLLEIYQESKKPVAGSSDAKSGTRWERNGNVMREVNAVPSWFSAEQLELLKLVNSPESSIWFPLRDTPEHMSRAEKDRYGALESNLDKIAAHATNPPPARAMILADLPEPFEQHIFKRGNPARLGEPVPRAFPALLTGGEAKPFRHGSGRLELAEAIGSAVNPLTARVFVNRVWMEHFGEPLVNSTTDFGARSEAPLHRELLDWLATDFIRSGWSVKHLHRVILLSSAYQQDSGVDNTPRRGRERQRPDDQKATADPEDKLLPHFRRRRLDFEAMRDSLLFVAGRLDLTMGGPSMDLAGDPMNKRRTVYGLVDRQNLPALFRAFDFPVPDQCSERRPRTAVPQQTLFGLNSPFVMEQARALAASVGIASDKIRNRRDAARQRGDKLNELSPQAGSPAIQQVGNLRYNAGAQGIDTLFRRVLGRNATKGESESCLQFLKAARQEQITDNGLQPLEQLAQVLLICNEALFLD